MKLRQVLKKILTRTNYSSKYEINFGCLLISSLIDCIPDIVAFIVLFFKSQICIMQSDEFVTIKLSSFVIKIDHNSW